MAVWNWSALNNCHYSLEHTGALPEMAMLNVKADIREVVGFMKSLQKQGLKVAKSTLNTTAFRLAKNDWPKIAEREIKNPTKFTKRGARFDKATETKLTAMVFLAPIQERYLLPILAGARIKKIVPGVIKLNRFGNILSLRAGKIVNTLLAKAGHFRQTINGTDAIWLRVGGRLRPVLLFDTTLVIRKRFDFAREMEKKAKRRIPAVARHELRRALAKAR